MIPLVVLGIGALLGSSAVYVAGQRDKKKIQELVLKQQETIDSYEQRRKEATDREKKLRIELLLSSLQWSKERLNTLYQRSDTPLIQLERVLSLGVALEKIIKNLPADGVLDAESQAFVELVRKAQNGEALGKVDRARIEEYLDAHVGDIRQQFLEEQLVRQYSEAAIRIAELEEKIYKDELRQRALELRRQVEGEGAGGGAEMGSHALLASIERDKEKVSQSRLHLQQHGRALVVLARVCRPEEATDETQREDDRIALGIVQALARGATLAADEEQFLDYYQACYLSRAREILIEKYKIDIIRQQVTA